MLPPRRPAAVLLVVLAAAVAGCRLGGRAPDVPPPPDRIDPAAEAERPLIDFRELTAAAEQVRASRRPPAPPERPYNVLALSGGGSYGAYAAGVLCGWTARGDRPEFDVVTGVSTGALIAPLAFLGPKYDPALRHFFTAHSARDVFRRKPPVRAVLLSDSLADNTPLRREVERLFTDDVLREIAAAHAAGRRLYAGTTDLETLRLVVWDLGAIAARGTPAGRDLFVRVLMASAAVPGFFPPERIPVEVDGRWCEELHTDGGVSAELFARAPPVRPGRPASLAGSNLYVLVARKLYPNPAPVAPRTLPIARRGLSSVVHAETRAEVVKLYTATMLVGMNFRVAAIPRDVPTPGDANDFDTATMAGLFEAGYRRAAAGQAWRATPGGAEEGEAPRVRTGTRLTAGGGERSAPD
jgi:predicted acylesterase/phospholipase RssA